MGGGSEEAGCLKQGDAGGEVAGDDKTQGATLAVLKVGWGEGHGKKGAETERIGYWESPSRGC